MQKGPRKRDNVDINVAKPCIKNVRPMMLKMSLQIEMRPVASSCLSMIASTSSRTVDDLSLLLRIAVS